MNKIWKKQLWTAANPVILKGRMCDRPLQLLTGPVEPKLLPDQLQTWLAINTVYFDLPKTYTCIGFLQCRIRAHTLQPLCPECNSYHKLWFTFWEIKFPESHFRTIWTWSSVLKIHSAKWIWMCGQAGVVASCDMRESEVNREGPRQSAKNWA